MRTAFALLSISLALNFTLQAQNEYTFERIDINSGLANNSVISISQDSKGFVWIGMANDWQRFDMYDFISLPKIVGFNKLFVDKRDRVWICFTRIGLYDPLTKKVETIPVYDHGNEILLLAQPNIIDDSRGRLWLIFKRPDEPSSGSHLFIYDEQKKQFVTYETVLPKFNRNIIGITDDGNGNYWIATAEGLVYYDDKTKRYYDQQSPENSLHKIKDLQKFIYYVCKDKKGRLIVIVWAPPAGPALYILDHNAIQYEFHDFGEIRSIQVDRSNTVWLAGEFFYKLNPETGSFEKIRLPEDVKIITSSLEDKEGNIWFGTPRGLLVFNPNQRVFNKSHIRNDGQTTDVETLSLLKMSDDIIVAGTWGDQRLFFYDESLNQLRSFELFSRLDLRALKENPIWSLFEDVEKNLWIGAQHGKLFKVDRKNKKVLSYDESIFNHETIRNITGDSYGNLWFSTQRRKIIKWDKEANHFQQIDLHENPAGFVFFHADKNYLWVSLGLHLIKLNPLTNEIIKKYPVKLNSAADDKANTLNKIVSISENKIHIGSSLGLTTFDTQTETFQLHKLPGGVFSIEPMGEPNQFMLGLSDGSLVEYKNGELNYLQRGNVISPSASTRLRNGTFVFGTESGMTVIRPKEKSIAPQILPPPTITSIRLLNRELNIDSVLSKDLTLPFDQNHFSITFSALAFQDRDNVKYYGRINKKMDFIDLGNQRVISYAKLQSGEYDLEIYYMMPDGRKSALISFPVIVLKPFWLRTWFIGTVLIVTAALIFVYYRINRSKAQALAKIRERISSDLHDEMGSNLSTISILSNVARGTLAQPEKTTKVIEMLDKMNKLLLQVMETVDDIVWSVNPKNESFEEIIKRMRVIGVMLEDQGIRFDFIIEGNSNHFKTDLEKRNQFYLIYKEVINNIAKHAKCKNVSVKLLMNPNLIQLIIQDDGIGFDVNSPASGNGLRNIRSRSLKLKGKISVESMIGRGTTTSLEFPV